MTVASLQHALQEVAEWDKHHRPTVPQPILAAHQRRKSAEHRLAGVITDVRIAQNRRQAAVADARAQANYAVNVRAESEVSRLLFLLEALVEHYA